MSVREDDPPRPRRWRTSRGPATGSGPSPPGREEELQPGEETEGDSADSVESVGLAASASDTTGPLASYSAGTAGGTAGTAGGSSSGQKGSPIPWAPYQQQQAPSEGQAAAADGGGDDGEDVDTKIEQLRAVAGLLLDKAEELEQRL